MMELIVLGVVVVVAFAAIGLVMAKLYQRASSSVAFVRTGMGGKKVVMNGGCLVLPIFHDTVPVNLETLKLEVEREGYDSLFTRDRVRMDVKAAFFVRVEGKEENVLNASQTLGPRTMNVGELARLVEEKFVDALRSAAISMTMKELMDRRQNFIQAVQEAVSEELLKNGLILESVSLTRIDQTPTKFFDPTNALDAEGLAYLTAATQQRAKERNQIEQDTAVEIAAKNFEAQQRQLQIEKESKFAKLEQEREVSNRTAEQAAEVARIAAERNREAEEARITSERAVQEAEVSREAAVKQRKIETDRAIAVQNIASAKEQQLAQQETAISIAEKSKAQSKAEAEANEARAAAAQAEQAVITVNAVAEAERRRQVALVEASQEADRSAIGITVAAKATAEAAAAEAEAIRSRASAKELEYKVEAEGQRSINEAKNTLSAEQIEANLRLALIQILPTLVAESVKPMQQIEGIRIAQVTGMGGVNGNGQATGGDAGTSVPQSVVNAALGYTVQKPLIDTIMREVGLSGGLESLVGGQTLSNMVATPAKAPAPVGASIAEAVNTDEQ